MEQSAEMNRTIRRDMSADLRVEHGGHQRHREKSNDGVLVVFLERALLEVDLRGQIQDVIKM